MREVQRGRYMAVGPLAMFGQWQLSVQIDWPHGQVVTRRFMLGVDLPRGLLAAAKGTATDASPLQLVRN